VTLRILGNKKKRLYKMAEEADLKKAKPTEETTDNDNDNDNDDDDDDDSEQNSN